ncbi:MAG: undecaprenyl-diphosphate phosphatase [Pirellulaceae bacterium]
MDDWKMVLLAIVQGLTEFLPVSSSGHLVVANALLSAAVGRPLPDLVEVSIFLHLGTLLSILVFYRRRILRLLGADRRVAALLLVGTLPAVAMALLLEAFASHLLESPLLAGLMFPATAVLLIVSSRRDPGEVDYTSLTWPRALLIGAAQAVAILPGVSRSGATIAAGLLLGLRRDSATAFAFLLAIPAIAGAVVLQLWKMSHTSAATSVGLLTLGAAIAFVVGLAALTLLTKLVTHGRLHWFAWWLVPLGAAVTAWQLTMLFSSG